MKKFLIASPLIILFACGVKDHGNQINYLNRTPPDSIAKLFAPGIVSTDSFEHSSPMFSPDGRVVLWNVVSLSGPDYLIESNYENGEWSAPHKPSFGDKLADDYYPQFSSDGKTLYFSSRRSLPAGYQGNNMRIWQVDRNENGWGTPVPFDSTISKGTEYAHSITNDGKLYYSTQSDWNIHVGNETLPFGINTANYEDGAMIAPDESFLIFESLRAEGIEGSIDLYVSFRLDDNTWSLPVNMGPTINTAKSERMGKLSPDGKYLFWGSNRNPNPKAIGFDIYWIDAKIIDKLRNDPRAKTIIERPLGDEIIRALTDDFADEALPLLREWVSKYPDDAEGLRTYMSVLRRQRRFDEAAKVYEAGSKNNVMLNMEEAIASYGLGLNNKADSLLKPILTPSEELNSRYNYVINGLQESGLYDISDQYFDRFASGGIHPVHMYNRACFYSKLGKTDKAFAYLDRAIEGGYVDAAQYENDTDLTNLKSDRRWAQLKTKLK